MMCNECAIKARERGEVVNYRPKYKPAEMAMQEFRYMQADNTFLRLRKLWTKLQIGEKYTVFVKQRYAEGYKAKCTLIAKYPKFALFKSERGLCYCFGYHAIMTEEIVYTDDLTPRRVTT